MRERGSKMNMALVYGIVAGVSVILMLNYFLWEKKKELNFALLFSCIAIANCGYFMQSVSKGVSGALWANRVSYFGCAYLVLLMLLIIMDGCQFSRKKWHSIALIAVSSFAFLLAASGDWQGLYYKAVSVIEVNGMTRLVKDYGPLHILYPVYLLSYFAVMVLVIWRSAKAGKLSSPKYAVFLAAVVLLNIGVWAVEQFVDVDFEFLSVSYILTGIILLLIYGVLRDYGIIQPGGALLSVEMLRNLQTKSEETVALPQGMERMFSAFAGKVGSLSTAERRILNYYIAGREISEIPDLAYISINTVKKHNRSIYQKLNVASRDELMLYIELFRCCGRLEEIYKEIEE